MAELRRGSGDPEARQGRNRVTVGRHCGVMYVSGERKSRGQWPRQLCSVWLWTQSTSLWLESPADRQNMPAEHVAASQIPSIHTIYLLPTPTPPTNHHYSLLISLLQWMEMETGRQACHLCLKRAGALPHTFYLPLFTFVANVETGQRKS